MILMRNITFPKPFVHKTLLSRLSFFSLIPSLKKGKARPLLPELISDSSHVYPCSLHWSPTDTLFFLEPTESMLASWPFNLLFSLPWYPLIFSLSSFLPVSLVGKIKSEAAESNTCCLLRGSPKAELEKIYLSLCRKGPQKISLGKRQERQSIRDVFSSQLPLWAMGT